MILQRAQRAQLGAWPVRDRQAKLLVIDGLRSVRDLWQDEAMLREFMYDLNVGMAAAVGAIGLTSEES